MAALAARFFLGAFFFADCRVGFVDFVVTPDVLQPTMAGPAIRAWQIAQALAKEHEVQLVTTVRCNLSHPDYDGGVDDAASGGTHNR